MPRKENAMKRKPAESKSNQVESLAYSVESFCQAYGISRPTLYKMWKEGTGPEYMQIGRRVLIPIESSNAWRKRMTTGAAEVRS